ncbi:MAG: alpha/beta fold hydrolase, partial [Baekduiaceae bacterium]
LVLREPERFTTYLALNIAHPWNTARTMGPHLWRFALYQPIMALAGRWLQQRTPFLRILFRIAVKDRTNVSDADIALFADRFRDPVCARTGQQTYRTFLLHELPALGRTPESRRSTVRTVALFGDQDTAISEKLAAEETANADDYTLKLVPGAGHFIADERPELVRAEVEALFASAARAGDAAA